MRPIRIFVSASQIRAARALLNWSQERLAGTSGLSVATIRKLEAGHISPRAETTRLIKRTFEVAGLEFIEHEGLRQRPDDIKVYQGQEGLRDFYDDVYASAKSNSGDETVIIHPSAKRYYVDLLSDFAQVHTERMTKIRESISVKCLVSSDPDELPAKSYCDYRLISKGYVDVAPSYVYDNKYAIIILEANPSPKIIVIHSKVVAEALRIQFYSLWDKATPLGASLARGKPIELKNKTTRK